MKTWIKSLAGFALSAFLAIGLSGRVNASDTDGTDPLPDPSPYEMEDPADSGDADGLLRTVNIDGDTNDDDDGDDADDDDADGGDADGGDTDGGDTDGDDADGDDADDGDADDGDGAFLSLSMNNLVDDPAAGDAADGAGVAGVTEGNDADGNAAGIDVPSDVPITEEGAVVLVNYDNDDAVIASEGELVILAAGINHVKEIASDIMTRIAGTGILLVDKLTGPVSLMTMDELNSEGSVALFEQQENGDYLLLNGQVPGILDENYTVTGVTLVIPENASLILPSSAADYDPETGAVNHYPNGGMNANIQNKDTYQETTGYLTIGDGARLIIEENASVDLRSIKSIEGGKTICPVITVEGTGKLHVDGSIQGNGRLNAHGPDCSLTGAGRVSGHWCVVTSPASIADTDLTFAFSEMAILGSGTINTLNLDKTSFYDSKSLYLCGQQTIENLISKNGTTELVIHDKAAFRNIRIHGSVMMYFTQLYDEYTDSIASTITGAVTGFRSGSDDAPAADDEIFGTLSLKSGVFLFSETASLGAHTAITYGYPLVYDYAGITGASLSPLHISPEEATTVSESGDPAIPLFISQVTMGPSTSFLAAELGVSQYEDSWLNKSIDQPDHCTAAYSDGHYSLDLGDIESIVRSLRENDSKLEPVLVIVDVLHESDDHVLSRTFYRNGQKLLIKYDTESEGYTASHPMINELVGRIPADDVYCVRIVFLFDCDAPWGGGTASPTSTSFTGSGILGGAGAGSVRYGSSTYVIRPATPAEDPSDDPGGNADPDGSEGRVSAQSEPESIQTAVTPSAAENVFVLSAIQGGMPISRLNGGTVAVRFSFQLPAAWESRPVYAVFRNADGTLTAFLVRYSSITQTVTFESPLLGEFALVSPDLAPEPYTPAFYAALEELPEVQKLQAGL
ncbi:MAG: hypothetical protein IJH47_07100 [Oscillospiraceae bacterium]|nr:hypothetical protein [Oscillospiraceae bacterium]